MEIKSADLFFWSLGSSKKSLKNAGSHYGKAKSKDRYKERVVRMK